MLCRNEGKQRIDSKKLHNASNHLSLMLVSSTICNQGFNHSFDAKLHTACSGFEVFDVKLHNASNGLDILSSAICKQ